MVYFLYKDLSNHFRTQDKAETYIQYMQVIFNFIWKNIEQMHDDCPTKHMLQWIKQQQYNFHHNSIATKNTDNILLQKWKTQAP